MDLLNLKCDDYLDISEVVVNPRRTDVYITLKSKTTTCYHCGSTRIVKKEWKTKLVKYQLYEGKESIVHIRYCRYKCKECNKTFSEKNSIALKGYKISFPLIRKVIKELSDPNSTYQKTAERCNVSNSTVLNILDHFVQFNPRPLPYILAIDEIYVQPNENAPYACVLLDQQTGKLIDILKGRSKITLNNYFLSKSDENRAKVQYITIDMWEPYLAVAQRCFPNAVVAIDSFHVMEHFIRAVNKIRCEAINQYETNSYEYYVFKKIRTLIFKANISFKRKWNKKFKAFMSEYDWIEMACNYSNKFKVAYLFYERYHCLNKNSNISTAESNIDHFLETTQEANEIDELREIKEMIAHWKPWIVNSFIIINEKRLSNGPIEGANSTLKKIKKTMGKIDNFNRYRLRCKLVINRDLNIFYSKDNTIKKVGKKRGKYKKKKRQS